MNKMDNHNHKEVIDGCKRFERNYQEIFFNYYYPRLIAVSLRMSPNKTIAEDLLQDAFIKIFMNIGSMNKHNVEVVYTWSKKILSNIIYDYYRQNPHRLLLNMDEVIDGVLYVDNDEDEDDNYLDSKDVTPKMLQEAIETLSPQYKLVFSMYLMEGYQHNEISEILGISISTSKTNYMKARRHLQKILEPCTP